MVDYTREMRRGRTLQDRERELQPINKQLDDERVMIKDYTHDQVVAARARENVRLIWNVSVRFLRS